MLIAGAFPIRRLVGSRPTLAGRLLLWWIGIFACLEDSVTLLGSTEPLHHAAMLPPSPLFCNRPDKEQSLLITAAQRLRTSPDMGDFDLANHRHRRRMLADFPFLIRSSFLERCI